MIPILLMLLTAFSAEAEDVIPINRDLEPRTREETLEMLSAQTDAYFRDEAIAAELSGEISRSEMPGSIQ